MTNPTFTPAEMREMADRLKRSRRSPQPPRTVTITADGADSLEAALRYAAAALEGATGRVGDVTACGLSMDALHEVARALDAERVQENCAHVRKGAVPEGVRCRTCRKLWAGERGDAVWQEMIDAMRDNDDVLEAIQ